MHSTVVPKGQGIARQDRIWPRTSLLSLNLSLILTKPFRCSAPAYRIKKTMNNPWSFPKRPMSPALQSPLPQLFLSLHEQLHMWMRLEDLGDETSGNPDLTWLTRGEEGTRSSWLQRWFILPEIPCASSFENMELIIFLITFRYS